MSHCSILMTLPAAAVQHKSKSPPATVGDTLTHKLNYDNFKLCIYFLVKMTDMAKLHQVSKITQLAVHKEKSQECMLKRMDMQAH